MEPLPVRSTTEERIVAMVGKKMEGNEEQRRAAGRRARRAGDQPSADQATKGASKQRSHQRHGGSASHEDRLAAVHRGKQQWPDETAEQEVHDPGAKEPVPLFAGRGHPEYSERHEQVFAALARAVNEHRGQAVHLEDVARAAGLPRDATRPLLHDLVVTHRVARELSEVDDPDQGPRYEVRNRG
ncbi:hypothetical protein [Wenjunlia vitaminophila]|nr:hypothetical protein [Wenjunlia vitaminophila]